MATGDVDVKVTTNTSRLGVFFNGVDSNVNFGTCPTYSKGFTNLSVSMWLLLDSNDFDGLPQTLMDNSTSNANVNGGFYIALDDRGGANPTNGFNISIDTVGTSVISLKKNNVIAAVKAVYHVVVTYDSGTSTAKLYLNGADTNATQGGGGSGNYNPRNDNLYIGTNNSGAVAYLGMMGDVQIFREALTATEVLQLYQRKEITRSLTNKWDFVDQTYNDKVGTSDGTGSGTHIAIGETAINGIIKGQRLTATDKFLLAGLSGGQVVSVAIEET